MWNNYTSGKRNVGRKERTIVHVCSLPVNMHTNPVKAADFIVLFLLFGTKNANICQNSRMYLNLHPDHTDLQLNGLLMRAIMQKQASKFSFRLVTNVDVVFRSRAFTERAAADIRRMHNSSSHAFTIQSELDHLSLHFNLTPRNYKSSEYFW